jgi:hypothetical protein
VASDDYVGLKEFAELQGVEQRTVRNWLRYDPPLPHRASTKKRGIQIPVKRGIAWRVQFELRRQAAENAPTKTAAKRRLEEIRVAREEIGLRKEQDQIVVAHVHRARVAQLVEHFAGTIKGQMPRYVNDIQLAESPVAARQLAERIRDDLLDALQRTADTIDEDPGPDDLANVDVGAAGAAA